MYHYCNMENEELYNTHFCVKYKSIEKELLSLGSGAPRTQLPDDYEYSEEDVYDICSKLYRDEYASVFYCNNILDDKIDENLRKLYDLFSLNNDFLDCLSRMMDFVKEIRSMTTEEEDDYKYFCFLSLFGEDLFYLTHMFVCDFLKTNVINKEVFEEIFTQWKITTN